MQKQENPIFIIHLTYSLFYIYFIFGQAIQCIFQIATFKINASHRFLSNARFNTYYEMYNNVSKYKLWSPLINQSYHYHKKFINNATCVPLSFKINSQKKILESKSAKIIFPLPLSFIVLLKISSREDLSKTESPFSTNDQISILYYKGRYEIFRISFK